MDRATSKKVISHPKKSSPDLVVGTNRVKSKSEQIRWDIKPSWPERCHLADRLGVPELIAQLLYNRGLSDPDRARAFLQPSLSDLIEPDAFTGIPAAVKRIRRAIAEHEKIVIYGDYDVDGIVAVAILWRCLKLAGVTVDFYVPHRIEEGYGLNVEAIEQLAAQGANLIITVDCGVTAHESARRAAELGLDLVITDHHRIDDQPIRAAAVVHPDLPGQDYPNKFLCGAGVAFKLAWALAREFSGAQKVSDEFRRFLLDATALASLGTVADVVSLRGENRILARFGLEALAAGNDPAVRALIRASGLQGAKLDSTDIGFRLAPRLNAAGRMGHARLAVEMFTHSSPARAEEIAAYLEAQNRQRQKVERRITEQAVQQVKQLKMDRGDSAALVVAGEDWHAGVIGIVAGRLVDRFHRPAVVISLASDRAMGSCRSVPGFDICEALRGCTEHLRSFGGHAMAAGLTLDPARLDDFRVAFQEAAQIHLTPADRAPALAIDAEIDLAQLTLPLLDTINRLGPFGEGNPRIRLLARRLKLIGPPRRIGGAGRHLDFLVAAADESDPTLRPGAVVRAVAFGRADWEKPISAAATVDLVFEPTINRFNGNTTVEMLVEDVRCHD